MKKKRWFLFGVLFLMSMMVLEGCGKQHMNGTGQKTAEDSSFFSDKEKISSEETEIEQKEVQFPYELEEGKFLSLTV